MSKEGALMTVGILTALSPFSGLPLSWLSWILPIFGIIAVSIGYSIRKQRMVEHAAVEPEAAPALPAIDHYEAPSPIA